MMNSEEQANHVYDVSLNTDSRAYTFSFIVEEMKNAFKFLVETLQGNEHNIKIDLRGVE